jgi:glycosyltransferase involved in cell wall biosynthesis
MRVLMLCSSYSRYATDSASIFLRRLAQALSREGAEIQVLAPDHILVDKSFFDPAIRLFHFRYFPRQWQALAYGSGILPNLRQNPWLWFQVPFFLLSMFFVLLLLCRRHRPDIIHAHWILPQGLIAICVGRILNIPVVTTAHGGDAFSLRGGILSALKRFALRHSQAWTANTKTTAAEVEKLGEMSAPHIVPMGVDIEQFCIPVTPPTNTGNKKTVVLFVGRLVEKKGVADLLKAFASLPENQLAKTELRVIGDGTERHNLETLARILNIDSSSISFLGRMSHDALPAYYASADLFVAPSIIDRSGDTEGQGVVLIEAMASGLPVIAYKTGGIQDVINHGDTGILVTPRDIQGLSNAIGTLLQDSNLRQRLGLAGRRHAQSHFAWEVVAKQFLEIFSDVLRERPASTLHL